MKSLEDELSVFVSVAKCLELLLKKGYRLDEREPAFRELCLEAIDREVSPTERCTAALVLGRLGDPRVVVDLQKHDTCDGLKRPAFVKIPAGNYLLGVDKKPWRLTHSFLLSRYPVTNSQFALFVDDGGYQEEKEDLWSKRGWQWLLEQKIQEPRCWRSAKWNGPNQPVVGVSFYEAQAFAKWAGCRLPTGNEWEAAARGPDGYKYPWGDDWEDGICNATVVKPACTTPVGMFPRSRSKTFGLEDMAGNVWEWCTNEWIKGRPYLVSHGGNWGSPSSSCRCVYRNRTTWGDRFEGLGFRVAADLEGE